MSFIAVPASVAWLQTADPNIVQYEHFLQCAHDYLAWQRACERHPDAFVQTPEEFVKPGDLQDYVENVVNWWPKDAPRQFAMPTLYKLLTDILDHDGRTRTFMSAMADYMGEIHAWMIGVGKDPSNPNETAEEKAKRKNAERQARWRLRHSNTQSDDPTLNALLEAAKAADANAVQGKRWLKGEIQQAKLDMDSAIAKAKLDRVERVQRAEAAVADAVRQAQSARDAVDSYRINK